MNKQERKDFESRISALESELAALKGRVEADDAEQEFPQDGDEYYYIACDGTIGYFDHYDNDDLSDVYRLSIDNIFRTKEEAEFEVERLKVIAELKGFAEPFDKDIVQFSLAYYAEPKVLSYLQCREAMYGADIYFHSAENVWEAIDNVGEERIIKYYFRQGENNNG